MAGADFRRSENNYDWLGHGIYFWEANPKRGLEFITEVESRKQKCQADPSTVSVVGAVIDLGYCLDLMSSTALRALPFAYEDVFRTAKLAGGLLPQNSGGSDLLRRNLDCAVINHLHYIRDQQGSNAFDTVRGVFIEGDPVYPTAGFREKTHIQICVRNTNCIKGVFRVPPDQTA